MAIYDFRCKDEKCAAVQEHICPMGDRPESLTCKKCGGVSEQVILKAPGLLTSGMTCPPLDVVVGRDAAKRWERINEKQAIRDKVRRDSGKQGLEQVGVKQYKAHDKQLQFVSTPEPNED